MVEARNANYLPIVYIIFHRINFYSKTFERHNISGLTLINNTSHFMYHCLSPNFTHTEIPRYCTINTYKLLTSSIDNLIFSHQSHSSVFFLP